MGCGGSKGTDDRKHLIRASSTVRGGANVEHRGSFHEDDNFLVRECSDEDVHEVYDFTGPVLGTGAFSTVLRVKDRVSGFEYAIKQINLARLKYDENLINMLHNEIEGMKMISHPNIIRLQEVYKPKGEDMVYLVLDRLEGGSVEGLLKQEGHIEENHAAYIIAQVVDAVRYCHGLGIAHRDLKLANCMFEDTSPAPIVKVIDFGLCAELKDGETSSAFVGTLTHAAPEIVKVNTGHGLQCDMWSIGVMTYALIGGRLPFYAKNPTALQNMIKFHQQTYTGANWTGVSASCRDFIDKCLIKNPKKRLTSAQAQAHPWIRNASKAMEGEPLSEGAVVAMMKFQESNMFQKIAMELVAYTYELSQIRDLEEHFREWDVDGTGTISLSEFKAAVMERKRAIVRKGQYFTPAAPEEVSASSAVANTDPEATKPIDTSGDVEADDPGGQGVVGGEGGGGEREEGSDALDGAEDKEQLPSLTTGRFKRLSSLTMGEVGHTVRKLGEGGGQGPETGGVGTGAQDPCSISSSRMGYSMVAGLDEEAVEKMFHAMDINNNGRVCITEFVAACLQKLQVNDSAIKAAFERLDRHRTGLISFEDVRMYLGDMFDDYKLAGYMREISRRSDGQVTFDDFRRCLNAHGVNPHLSPTSDMKK